MAAAGGLLLWSAAALAPHLFAAPHLSAVMIVAFLIGGGRLGLSRRRPVAGRFRGLGRRLADRTGQKVVITVAHQALP